MERIIRSLRVGLFLAALGAAGAAAADEGWRPAHGVARGGRDGREASGVQVRAEGGRADLQRLVYRFDAPTLLPQADGRVRIDLRGADLSGAVGAPLLPVIPARVVVPQGHRVVQVRVIPGTQRLLAEGVKLQHAAQIYPLSKPELATRPTAPDAVIYGSDAAYPVEPHTVGGLHRKSGVAFENVILRPVSYRPQSGRVYWYETLTVEILTTPEAPRGKRAAGEYRSRYRGTQDGMAAADLADNPRTLSTYVTEPVVVDDAELKSGAAAGGTVSRMDASGSYAPTLPCATNENLGQGYQHVVVTHSLLQTSFAPLVALRRTQGLTSAMVLIEDIVAIYPGSDPAEKLRNFIRDAYNKWGTQHVLLGGDTMMVPMRYLYCRDPSEPDAGDQIPSDLYFQCLDGSYNDDADGQWGEPGDGAGGYDVDLYAEVTIGRVSAESANEVARWFYKTQVYEGDKLAGSDPYLHQALMLGEHLGFGGVSEYATPMMEQIRNGSSEYFTTRGFAPFDLYAVDTLYDSESGRWTDTDLIVTINSNLYSVINHLGHANTDYSMRLTSFMADARLSNTNPIFVYSQGCIAGAFDRDCIAEHFTTSTTFGLFAGVFNSRYGWGANDSTLGPSQTFNRHFWDVFFNEWATKLGQLNQLAHERVASQVSPDPKTSGLRWSYYASNLFGDPVQELVGYAPLLRFDRGAYKSTADANLEVVLPPIFSGMPSLDVVTTMSDTNGVVVAVATQTCTFAESVGVQRIYRCASFPVASMLASNGFLLHAEVQIARFYIDGSPLRPWNTLLLQDDAPIDDIPPVISNVSVLSTDDGQLTVFWLTDEIASGGAQLDKVVPPTRYAWLDGAYTNTHAAVFSGLEEFKRYFAAIWAEDPAGNRTDVPEYVGSSDESDYPVGGTAGRELITSFDMERNESGWSVQSIAGAECWQYGVPTYGPEASSRCWGTILDGRYPDSVNATLVSPVVLVRDAPLITFRQWRDIELSTDDTTGIEMLNADSGIIEVLSGGSWHNVMSYAEPKWVWNFAPNGIFTGASAGWEEVTVKLPAAFANQPLQVRFRFVSDTLHQTTQGNPAGWYIDDVVFTDRSASGLGISDLMIDDSAPGGDGDGVPEPGEHLRIQIGTFNFGDSDIAIREGSFALLVGGSPATQIRLTNGSPAPLFYGTVPAFNGAVSGWYDVEIDPDMPSGSVVTLLQTLVGVDGRLYENHIGLTVRRTAPIAGHVVQRILGVDTGVPDVSVTASQGDELYTAITDAGGAFTLTDATSNRVYRVAARLGGASSATDVLAPTNGLILRLGLALLDLSTTNIALSAPFFGRAGASFVLSNAAPATAALQYSMAITYALPTTPWLSITNPATLEGVLAPGGSVTCDLLADALAAGLKPGVYTAQITIDSNDSDDLPDIVWVTFTVTDDLFIEFAGVRVDDRPDPLFNPFIDGDGDGYLEGGESAALYISLRNLNLLTDVADVTGTVSVVTTGAATVLPNVLGWPPIPAGVSAESVNAVGVTFHPPSDLPLVWFRLAGADGSGRPFTRDFAITNCTFYSVTGIVQSVTYLPMTPTNRVTPVEGAIITAQAPDGTVYSSAPTGADGVYRVDGLAEAAYWFNVVTTNTAIDTTLVPPAGINIVVTTALMTGGNQPVIFQTADYGPTAPHLHHVGLLVDDGPFGDNDGAIDPGERLTVNVILKNVAPSMAYAVTGGLQTAIMDRPDVMTVVEGVASQATNFHANVNAGLGPTFVVDVASDAPIGSFQRFWLRSAVSNAPVMAWPFDFRLPVYPLYAISGEVTFSDGSSAAKMAATRIVATSATGVRYSTIPDSDGQYKLARLPPSQNYLVRVEQVPPGYIATGFVDIYLDTDKTGVNFTVDPWSVTASPTAFNKTLPERVSTSDTFTVVNNSASNLTLDVDIRFARAANDIITPATAALNAMVSQIPLDWSALDAERFVPNEIEIRFKDGTPMGARLAYLKAHGLRAIFHFNHIAAVLAEPARQGFSLAATGVTGPAALADDTVVYAQPSVRATLQDMPNDTLFDQQWALQNRRQTGGTLGADINVAPVWESGATGSAKTVVAVFDTGLMYTHPDVMPNIWVNPLERYLDANLDGFPGLKGEDDDHDAARQTQRRDPATGALLVELPNNHFDDDGDGLIDETGFDFEDEDVMLADFDMDGQIHVERGFRPNAVTGVTEYYEIIDPQDRVLAANDDDENGYIDDYYGWNFADPVMKRGNVNDMDGHGTAVASVIGAIGNNARGVSGINWDVRIMPLVILSEGAPISSARIAKAMEYALDQGVKVSNHSWSSIVHGSGILFETMRSGIEYDHLFVCAAGNGALDLDTTPTYPAAFSKVLDNVVTVAGSDMDDRIWGYSNYGDGSVHLTAPAEQVLCATLTAEGAGYAPVSGTSYAAPHVAGAAALLRSIAPDASFDAIKSAILRGVRVDPTLAGWVKTSGHLDVAGAVQAMGHTWLRIDGAPGDGTRMTLALPPGGSSILTLLFNDPPDLRAGRYEASINVLDDRGSLAVPVTLTVTPRAIAEIAALAYSNDSDGDSIPETSNLLDLKVTIRNVGTATFNSLAAVLTPVTAGASVATASNSCTYGYVSGQETVLPDRAFRITLPVSGTNALFNLTLSDEGVVVAVLPVNVPMTPRLTISGRVVLARATGTGVASARIEVWGAMGAAATADALGYFRVDGLVDGDYSLRAIPTDAARSAVIPVATLTEQNRAIGMVPVSYPLVAAPTNVISIALQQGVISNLTLVVSNAAVALADAYRFQVVESPRRHVALFDDVQRLGVLVAPLRQMGFEVDWYTNNFEVVNGINPANGANWNLQYVRYTLDDVNVFPYDFVIADISGPGGYGRPVTGDEVGVYERYLARGGKVLFTGVNPLSRPDNQELAALLGLDTATACDRTATNETLARATAPIIGPFLSLAAHVNLATAAQRYDLANLAEAVDAIALFTAGPANKLVRKHAAGAGMVYLWSGNPQADDWSVEGAWLDVLRNILWQELVENSPVTWLEAKPLAGTNTTQLAITLNGDRSSEPGTYQATLALLGGANAEEVVPIRIDLRVTPPTLRVHNTSGTVVDWGGRALVGDGGERSCIFQVMSAGTNGLPNAPRSDGTPGGDDILLTQFISGQAYGRFGVGYEQTPDLGKFDALFAHPIPVATTNAMIFVRAWDAASFAAAIAYGDSAVRHRLRHAPDEAADFGSWSVTNVIGVFTDSNGDSIPDKWTVAFRPDLDPRAPRVPLPTLVTTTPTNPIPGMSSPARLVVSSNFLFVLEKNAHRIAVYNRATKALVARYGKLSSGNPVIGTGNGEFNYPQGLGADPRLGTNRFAVADTGNSRVQIFTFNPATGVVTFDRAFSTLTGAPSGSVPGFSRPRAVAIDPNGYLIVADTNNKRVLRVSPAGAWDNVINLVAGSDSFTVPEGVCFDYYGSDGFWLADSDGSKKRVAFYSWSLGIQKIISGIFSDPVDVQVWQVGARKRLCVTDRNGGRVRVITLGGAVLADIGLGAQSYEKLTLPYGVTPVNQTRRIYVADQGNSRVVWYDLQLDGDGDGMDDIWEDQRNVVPYSLGPDSTIDDALADPDGDGVWNLGEFRINTNPRDFDSNDNGAGDLNDIVNGRDPLGPATPLFHPALLRTMSANPTLVLTGGYTIISATYNRAPTNAVNAFFYATDGSGMGSIPLTTDGSGTNFVGTFFASPSDLGPVDVQVRSLDQDPPLITSNDLFRIYRPLTAVVTWDPNEVEQGDPVTITATFSESVVNGTPRLSLTGAATLADTAMVKSNATLYTFIYATPPAALGAVTGTVSLARAQVTGELLTPAEFVFQIVLPLSLAQPPITTLEFPVPGTMRFGWPAVVGAGDPLQRFKIWHTPTLTPAAWTEIGTVDVAGPATMGYYDIDTSIYGPTHFFRIERIL